MRFGEVDHRSHDRLLDAVSRRGVVVGQLVPPRHCQGPLQQSVACAPAPTGDHLRLLPQVVRADLVLVDDVVTLRI